MKNLIVFLSLLFFSVSAQNAVIENYRQAVEAYKASDFEKAAELFEQVVREQPDNYQAHYNLGGVYEKLGRFEQAVGELMFVTHNNPADAQAKALLEVCIKKLINSLVEHAEKNPEDVDCFQKLAHLFHERGMYEEAVKYCDKALRLEKLPYMYNLKAMALYEMKEYEKAFVAIDNAFKMLPDDSEIFQNLQMITAARGKTAPEAAEISKVEENSEDPETKLNKMIADKKWDDALSYLSELSKSGSVSFDIKKKIAELNEWKDISQKARVYYERGEYYMKREQWEDAEKRFLEVLRCTPNDLKEEEIYLNLAEVYKNLKDYDQYIDICDKLIQIAPHPKYYYEKGIAFELKGDKEKAKELFETALNCDEKYFSDSPSLRSDIEYKIESFSTRQQLYLYAGVFFIFVCACIAGYFIYNLPQLKKKRYYKKLKKDFDDRRWQYVVDFAPFLEPLPFLRSEKEEIYYMTGVSHLEMERVDPAIISLQSAAKMNSKNEKVFLALARAYVKKGSFSTETLYAFRKLLVKEPDNVELLNIICKYYIRAKSSEEQLYRQDFFFNEKVAVFKKLLKLQPDNKEALQLLGEHYFASRDLSKDAMEIYRRLLKTDPDNARLRELLAECYLKNGKINECIDECRSIFSIDSSLNGSHDIFHEAMSQKGAVEELLMEYENMHEIEPESDVIVSRLQSLRMKYARERDASAVPRAPSIINIDEGLKKARESFNSGDINMAISQLKYLLARNPSDHNANLLLVKCYLGKGMIEPAYEQYALIAQGRENMSPEEKDICYRIGTGFEEKGKFKQALQMFDKICKIDISYRDAFEKFEEIYEFISK